MGGAAPGAWTRIDRDSFERAVDSAMRRAEELALGRARNMGVELRFSRFSWGIRLLPEEVDAVFAVPRGPVYGVEAIAMVNGEEMPLGATVAVGMYDESSGEGVIFDDMWIEAQLDDLEKVLSHLPDAEPR